jgi:DNA repair exonuclease SbcCD ATPase subunit
MKLSFVEIAGFRGFKERTRFDLSSGFVVLTGRNGAGKSTVLDAVDFVLTGTINKYEVTGAKGGGLSDHIWWVGEGAPDRQYVTIGFVDERGEEFMVIRSRERGIETSIDDMAERLYIGKPPERTWQETLMKTTLIRDETIASLSLDLPEQARFTAVRAAIGGLAGPDHSGRAGALLKAATLVESEQEGRVADAQTELGRSLSALTEARSMADRQADVTEAENIKTLAPDLGILSVDGSEMLRRRIADRKRSIPLLEEALAQAEHLQTEQLYFESDAGQAEVAGARADYEAMRQAKDQADEVLTRAQRLEASERERDAFASHMASLLDHGETVGLQEGHCPLCAAVRSSEEFASAIAAARSKLSERGSRAAEATAALEQARRSVKQKETLLAAAKQRLEKLEARRASLSINMENVDSIFRQWNLEASPSEPDNARRLVLQRQEETAGLEHALFMLEASSAHDRVTALETRVQQLRTQLDEETAKLTTTKRAVEAARQIENSAKSVANQVSTEQFDTVMPLLKEIYQRLRPHTDWRDIEMDFGGRVRASLNFTVGDGRNPQFLFSSGQRRAAGLAFLLALHLSRPWCRLRSLLLDDPVQHIDDYRALNLVEVLSAVRRTGRQVIIAVEDPALADVLCRRLRSTAIEGGRRFELSTAENGSATIKRQIDIFPLPSEILQAAGAY